MNDKIFESVKFLTPPILCGGIAAYAAFLLGVPLLIALMGAVIGSWLLSLAL